MGRLSSLQLHLSGRDAGGPETDAPHFAGGDAARWGGVFKLRAATELSFTARARSRCFRSAFSTDRKPSPRLAID